MVQCFIYQQMPAVPIYCVPSADITKFKSEFPQYASWLDHANFKGNAREICLIKNGDGQLKAVAYGPSEGYEAFWDGAFLVQNLPSHYDYSLQTDDIPTMPFYFSWGMGTYSFSSYKKQEKQFPKLYVADKEVGDQVDALINAHFMVRDLINTPANDLTPEAFADIAQDVATKHKARFNKISGSELETGFPLIHAVGKGSAHKPCLVHFTWGDKNHPKIALVGKGITFDTGGLDIKPSPHMTLMKKDMGGAAHILALADYIMTQNMPVQLDVYLPLAENSVSSTAYRPGDVLNSRKGLTIEIGNTDAEGRLVLADAMTYAQESKPDLLIDMATLTGAARVAVGTGISAMFGNEQENCNLLMETGETTYDPICQLPLWQPYAKHLKSPIADLNNDASTRYGGAIHAALFLEHFIEGDLPWMHFDIMAWNPSSAPGRPVGGEAMGLRAIISFIKTMYGA